MNYTEMLFNRDERLVNLLNQADSKNLELIEEINEKEDEIEKLQTQLQQKENIIKEVREYIENAFATGEEIFKVEILEILDKENK